MHVSTNRLVPPLMLAISIVLLTAMAPVPVAAVSAPYLVKNIKAGAEGSEPGDLTALNDVVVFSAGGGGKGRELWRTDGTTAGTVRVMDIRPGWRSSGVYGIARVGDVAYFEANDGVHGYELWVTDGTTLGTHMVKDILPGAAGGNPQQISYNDDHRVAVDVLGIAFFTMYGDPRLWRSDGTEEGTYAVPGSPRYLDNLTPLGNRVYFSGDGYLWRSNGTAAGTKIVKNKNGALMKAPYEMEATDSLLFFQYSNEKVWRSDGTAKGTFKVVDLPFGCSGYGCLGMSPTAHGDLLYFETESGSLWRSDGTASGTFSVGPGSDSYPTVMLGAGENFYFKAADHNLWATDGTPSSGHTVDRGPVDHCCWEMADVNGTLFFTGILAGPDTSKLFRYEPATNTTTEVGPTTAEDPLFLTLLDDRLIFSARDARGVELWAVNL